MEEEHQEQDENSLMVQNDLAPVDVDAAVEYWKAYNELTDRILVAADYQGKGKDRFKKKSAFRKYARAFNIKCKTIDEKITYDDNGRVITAKYIIRATLPNGRYEEGVGVCSIWDKSHEKDKKDRQGRVICDGPCNGRPHFTNPEHDVISTAYTRAKSRAISDVVGTGEVSAEEMEIRQAKKQSTKKEGTATKSKQTGKSTAKQSDKKTTNKKKVNKGVKTFKLKDGREVIPPEDSKEEPKPVQNVPVKDFKKTMKDSNLDADQKAYVALQTIEDMLIEDEKEITKLNKLKCADTLLKDKKITLEIFREVKTML